MSACTAVPVRRFAAKAQGEQDDRRARLARHPAVMRRAAMADRWLTKWRRALQKVFSAQIAEAVARLRRSGTMQVTARDVEDWAEDYYLATRPLTYETVLAGFRFAEQEFDAKSNDVYAALLAGKAVPEANVVIIPVEQGARVDAALRAEDPFLLTHDFAGTERYLRQVSKKAAETSRRRIQRVFDWAGREQATIQQTASLLLERGIADSRTRADLWARTGTLWSYNEGAHLSYIKHGVAVEEWYTAQDDLVCIDCGQLDGQKVRTSDPFLEAGTQLSSSVLPWNIEHPPLHPRCRCVLLPVLTAEM